MLNESVTDNSFNKKENKYICINCGFPVKELYKQYSSNVLKLTVCDNCYCEADKYIEFDLVLVIIDLVLLQRESYRHIINNTDFKGLWKLAFLILAMEAYGNWSLSSTPTVVSANEFHTGDFKFYRILAGVMIKHACFSLSTIVLTYLFGKYCMAKRILPIIMMKTITLSSFGVFLLLPSLIWDTGVHEFHFTFVLFYTTLSQLFAYEAICNCSKLRSIIVVGVSTLCKLYSSELYDNLEQHVLIMLK